MLIEFIFIGKTTEKLIDEGCIIYLKRIKKYIMAEVKIINVPLSGSNPIVQKRKEAESVLEKITTKDIVVLLDENGRQFSSEEFATQLNKFTESGKAKITFIVGGAYGSDQLVKQRADLQLSFSKLTFTHQMIRMILLEQVYRAFTILNNEKYHH